MKHDEIDGRTIRTFDGRVVGVIPTPSGPDWDGNFGWPRYERCILCRADTTGETAVLGVCFIEEGLKPGQVRLAWGPGDTLLIVHRDCWEGVHRIGAAHLN